MKIDKTRLLTNYTTKEEKIFASNILDKIRKYQNADILVYTNFLNLNEQKIAQEILNIEKVNYKIFDLNGILERKVIFLIPEYMEDASYLDNVVCLKICPLENNTLKHKDYMGALYNIGIQEDMIGDIIVKEDYAICFVMKQKLEYILYNLSKVGKNTVTVTEIDKFKEEISYSFDEVAITVASNRVDIILSHLYNLTRNETFEKIIQGDLIINGKENKNTSKTLNEGDIVSFRKCGKFKYGTIERTTKSGKYIIKLYKYV